MRKKWTEEDIECGRYICRESYTEDTKDISGLCSVTYKLGFISGASSCMCKIAITDGMVVTYQETENKNARQVLLERLNSDTYGYRLLSQNEITKRIQYLKSTHTGDDKNDKDVREQQQFDDWFKGIKHTILPSKEYVIPVHYTVYKQIAFAAWQEVNCRKNLEISMIKL